MRAALTARASPVESVRKSPEPSQTITTPWATGHVAGADWGANTAPARAAPRAPAAIRRSGVREFRRTGGPRGRHTGASDAHGRAFYRGGQPADQPERG